MYVRRKFFDVHAAWGSEIAALESAYRRAGSRHQAPSPGRRAMQARDGSTLPPTPTNSHPRGSERGEHKLLPGQNRVKSLPSWNKWSGTRRLASTTSS